MVTLSIGWIVVIILASVIVGMISGFRLARGHAVHIIGGKE